MRASYPPFSSPDSPCPATGPSADRNSYNNPLASPNAIPPRRSSTGVQFRASISGRSPSPSQSLGLAHSAPSPSVLRPVSEADWLGQRQPVAAAAAAAAAAIPTTTSSWGLPTLSPAMAIMQEPQRKEPQKGSVERFAHDDLDFTSKRTWTDDKERVIRAPFEYAISHPGKDFRAQLIAAFNALLQVPRESLDVITKVVAMLHESSLLVDDVQDSSELRRGFPVAHSIFGVAQTINSANYMCYVALQELQKLNSPQTIAVFANELVNLHRGQGMDLFWRDTLTCPSEEDYLEMVGNKTGGLFRLGIELMQAESSSAVDCVPLVNLVGLIYQIRDDYLNLSSGEYTNNKGLCEDLTEGKFSFPIIHSIRSDPANLQLINILKQKTTNVQVKRYAVAYMESTGSFAYTRTVLSTLIDRARRMAFDLDAGQGRAAGILKILDKMVLE